MQDITEPPNVKFYENPWIRKPNLTTGGRI